MASQTSRSQEEMVYDRGSGSFFKLRVVSDVCLETDQGS